MRRNRSALSFSRTARAITATSIVVLVLVLGACAVSPSLHQSFHSATNDPQHFCVVCAFANGQLHVADAGPLVVVSCVFLVCGVLAMETPLVSLFDFYFSPSRAPPR